MWISAFPVPFIEKNILPTLSCVGTIVEYQLTLNVRLYFLTFNSVPLMCMSVITLVPFSVGTFVITVEIREYESFDFFSPKIVLTVLDPLHFHMDFILFYYFFIIFTGILII